MSDNLRSVSDKRKNESSVIKDMAEMLGIGDNPVIVEIPIEKLLENTNHPFKILGDEKLKALAKSIDADGQLEPIIVRDKSNGFYEILAGHRRTRASKILGKASMQAIIVNVDDISANKILINSNLPQRDVIYPSELARSYKLRYDDLKRERKQNSDGRNFETEKKIDEILSEEFNVSKSSVYMHNNNSDYVITKVFHYKYEKDDYIGFGLGVEEPYYTWRDFFDKIYVTGTSIYNTKVLTDIQNNGEYALCINYTDKEGEDMIRYDYYNAEVEATVKDGGIRYKVTQYRGGTASTSDNLTFEQLKDVCSVS